MKALVTGGAGFLGRSLVNHLLTTEIEVRVIDKNIDELAVLKNTGLEVVEGSTENLETVQLAMKDIDVVYHLADTFSSKPGAVLETDVKGNINLLEAAAEYGVKHFMFSSTHRVYGKPRYLPVDEAHPLNPEESGRALYAIFNLANEKLCLWYRQERKLPVTIFRFWWAFEHDIGGKALRSIIDTALNGKPIRVPREAGGNFLHNNDAARAFHMASLNNRAYGEVFNLSSGTFTTWQELAQLVCRLTGSSSRIELVPKEKWQGDISVGSDLSIPYNCNLDISKAKRLIGYQPKYSAMEVKNLLQEAISRLVSIRKETNARNATYQTGIAGTHR